MGWESFLAVAQIPPNQPALEEPADEQYIPKVYLCINRLSLVSTKAWYPFYWSDYSGKTMHLTQGQHGAYLLFLRYIYTTEKPIPHKQRYSIARALTKQERADADAVLAEFFDKNFCDEWKNSRAFDVINAQAESYQRRAAAGKKGGTSKAKTRKPGSSNATTMLKQPEPLGSSKEEPKVGNDMSHKKLYPM